MVAFLNMFSPMHILLFLAVALLLFGRRLPEVGRSLGKGIMEFKRGLHEVSDELKQDESERPRRKLRTPPDDDDYEDDDEDEPRPAKRRRQPAAEDDTHEPDEEVEKRAGSPQ